MKEIELLIEIENHEPAHSFWKRAVLPYISENDDLELVRKCLTRRTWSDKQAQYLHNIACRKYGAVEGGAA